MKVYKKLILPAVLVLAGSFVSAASFSLQVIQIDGSENVVFDASYMIEQAILDFFYENLYIVSNSPVIIKKKNEDITAEIQKSFDAAVEGSLDLLIEASVYYNLSDSNNPEEAVISNIEKVEWKVIKLNGNAEIARGTSVPGKKYRNDDDGLYFFANEIAADIKTAIDSKGGKK
ncbi:MAG: hypothetical protein J6Y36_08095 [Treponema sp.]|uniref:hypothetical protein n=1 Tax=Treponema sp. TaxID=166 RepID=UPI001B408D44|nr:hypothetical protein [Treponema sp.]MBP5403103.1 hypothetical protein [Treponema sp.]MBR5934322.1 hypothetical protein [Treponema sp.]